VFRTGILSFHFSPVPHTANVRKRIRQLRDYVSVSADWICYALIDDITDSFAPIIHEIDEEADIIEDSVYVARDSDFMGILRRIGESRRKVMTLMRLLSGKADVIKMFAKRCQENWDNAPKGEIGLYLGDIQDHIFTMHQNLSVYERIFSRSHGNYMAQIQVESVASNNRVTSVLGKVTMLGSLLLPMHLITGLFGMNVTVPGEQQGNLKWFFGIVGVMIGLGIITFFVGKRLFLSQYDSRIPMSSGISVRSSAVSMLSRRSRRARANPRMSIRD
jgi:magnesium transporter